MAAIKDTLLDKDENEIYPKTVTDNVFDSEGNRLDNLIGSIKENINNITIHRKKVNVTVNTDGVGFLGNVGFDDRFTNIPFSCYTTNGIGLGAPIWGTVDNEWYIQSDIYKGRTIEVYILYVKNVVDDSN